MPTSTKNLNYITVREASVKTGLSIPQIQKLCQAGKIQAEKRGRDWLIDENSALAWVAVEPNTAHRKLGRPKRKLEL